MAAEKIALSDIVVDPSIQPRAGGLDEEHVADLRAAYEADEPVPRPVVWKIGPVKKLSQGFHRVEGAKRAGLTHLLCDVHTGVERECALDAFASNRDHGLKRSPEDKRRAIREVLKLYPDWSDSRVAERLGVSDKTVADERRKAEATSEIPKSSARVGRDGTKRPSAQPKLPIPQKPAAPPKLAPVPKPPVALPIPSKPQEGPVGYAGRLERALLALGEIEDVVATIRVWPTLDSLVALAGDVKWSAAKLPGREGYTQSCRQIVELRDYLTKLVALLKKQPGGKAA